MGKRPILRIAVTLALVAVITGTVIEERREARLPASGTPIVFRAVESAQDRAVILDIVARARWEFKLRDLAGALERGELRIADIDINRDGSPEYFVMNSAPRYCTKNGCAAQLFWLFNGRWQDWVGYAIREGQPWGVKRPGFRDYVVGTGYSREIFPFLEGREIDMRALQTDEERAFALMYLERELDMSNTVDFLGWRAAIEDGRITIAEADLDDDGQTERILAARGYGLCGEIGCPSLILRKDGTSWRAMTEVSLNGGFLLLDDKKFGWHRIFTGEEIYTFRGGAFFEAVEIDGADIERGEKFRPTP